MEQRVISILLRSPDEVLKHDLEPAEFENKWYGQVFSLIRKAVSNGETPDVFSISDQISQKDALTRLVDLETNIPAAASNLGHYISEVRKKAKAKRISEALQKSLSALNSENTPDEIIGELITELSGFNQTDNTKVFDGKAMMRETIDHLDTMYDLRSAGKLAGVPSGIGKLDKALGGFHPSDLVVVGARPAMGKTAFALSCATNAARQGFKVGFISTEMSVIQVGMRTTSLISGISASKMRDSSFEDSDWPLMTTATAQISELPLYIMDQPSVTVSDIAIQARAWAMTTGLDILYIDYLTRLKPEGRTENRTLAVGDIAASLKTLARTMNIPVIVLAQLSRDVAKRPKSIPNMSDLRDSGVIEQEADQVLMLYRPNVYDEAADEAEAHVIIEKNRHGETLTAKLEFHKETMRWLDPADNRYEGGWDE